MIARDSRFTGQYPLFQNGPQVLLQQIAEGFLKEILKAAALSNGTAQLAQSSHSSLRFATALDPCTVVRIPPTLRFPARPPKTHAP